jgi:drug/metabolite transporter (DMT)-like permease
VAAVVPRPELSRTTTPRGSHLEAPIVRAPRIYVVGALTVLVLGLNWPIMAWGLETIPPLWLTSLRLLGAGLGIAVVLALTSGFRLPPRPDYAIVASVALVRLALVYGLVTTALLFVPPGRSSLLTHTAGLWAAPIGAWALHERLTWMNALALGLGIGGVALLMDPSSLSAEGSAPLGYVMLLGAAVATAAATVHMRGHRWTATPLQLMPWQLLLAGVVTTIVALVVHGMPAFAWGTREIAVVAYEVFLASGWGVWGTIALSRSLPAVSTGILMMAVPAVGVVSSVLLVGEVLTAGALGGVLLVLVGVGLNVVADRRGTGTAPEPAP